MKMFGGRGRTRSIDTRIWIDRATEIPGRLSAVEDQT
jgi:hypothetical protein